MQGMAMADTPSDDRPSPAEHPLITLGNSRTFHLILAALVLAAMFGLAAGSARISSPTFDEGFYIARGWAFLKTGRLLPLGHPPLTNILSGLGVLLEPGLPQPSSLAGWQTDGKHLLDPAEMLSQDLLWHSGINTTRVIFLARLPIIFLALLLAAVVYRWGRELYGQWSGWLALVLLAFCPNILAHAGLATTDLGVAAFFIMTLYAWTRFLHRQTRFWLIASGVAFGLTQASKFSALVLIPLLGVMTLWVAMRTERPIQIPIRKAVGARCIIPLKSCVVRRVTSAIAALIVMGLIGLVALWASYLFSLRPYPLGSYVLEFRHFLDLAGDGHRAYMLGRFSDSGWWYYHPLVLAVKLSLPVLVLLAIAITLAVGREVQRREMEIIFPALAYLGVTMFGSLNVGIRYLLPILPLIFLFSVRMASGPARSGLVRHLIVGSVVVAHVAISLWHFPYYIPFFNLAVGGPNKGINFLADSNLDWGQDLPTLAQYLKDRGAIMPIYLSYFGRAEPAYYGIDYIALPGWPPPLPDPDRPKFYPMNPAPGLYAISVSNLVGVQLPEPDTFGYFRAREPVARLGHSIYVYEVLPSSAQIGENETWFLQCPATETEANLSQFTGVDDLQTLYVDACERGLGFAPGRGWILLEEGREPVVDLGAPDYLGRNEDGSPRYRIWQIDSLPPVPPSTVEFPAVHLPIPIAGHLELLGYITESEDPLSPGDTLLVTVWWRVREIVPNVSIFAHLTGLDETLLGGADALDVPSDEWIPGMVIVQQHHFVIPETAAPGLYSVSVGLYNYETNERYPVAQSGNRIIDRIVLTTVEIAANRE
jgi:hypothetical protein